VQARAGPVSVHVYCSPCLQVALYVQLPYLITSLCVCMSLCLAVIICLIANVYCTYNSAPASCECAQCICGYRLSAFSLALYHSLYSVLTPSPSLSVLRSILSLSLLPRSVYFVLLSAFSLGLYTSLYSVPLPSPSLSILHFCLSLSLPPRSLYFALVCLSPFSLAPVPRRWDVRWCRQ